MLKLILAKPLCKITCTSNRNPGLQLFWRLLSVISSFSGWDYYTGIAVVLCSSKGMGLSFRLQDFYQILDLLS